MAEFVGQNGAFQQQAGESVTRGDRRRRELEARSSSPPLARLLLESWPPPAGSALGCRRSYARCKALDAWGLPEGCVSGHPQILLTRQENPRGQARVEGMNEAEHLSLEGERP